MVALIFYAKGSILSRAAASALYHRVYLARPVIVSPLHILKKQKNGAEDGIRTRDPRLGKAML
ncbi:MAG TPA: hypothetical protein PLH05_02880, partial [Bacillota bacterium]|nr:hypothetical protein [Bacillota bacterium]